MSYIQNFLSPQEADKALLKLQDELQFIPRESLTFSIFGKTFPLPRDKAFYGEVQSDGSYPLYRYGGNRYPIVQPWTPTLREIRDTIHERTGNYCNHVVVNRYLTGNDHIGLHHDKEKDFVSGAPVCTLSFGGTRNLVLRHVDRPVKKTYPLAHGSLFILDSKTNKEYKHQIAKTSSAVQPRISLTFRNIKTMADSNGHVM